MTSIKPRGGHRIDVEGGGRIFLTDDSGDKVEVNRSLNVIWKHEDPLLGSSFNVPLLGGGFTAAGPEEAFLVAEFMQRSIITGDRRFEVRQVGKDAP